MLSAADVKTPEQTQAWLEKQNIPKILFRTNSKIRTQLNLQILAHYAGRYLTLPGADTRCFIEAVGQKWFCQLIDRAQPILLATSLMRMLVVTQPQYNISELIDSPVIAAKLFGASIIDSAPADLSVTQQFYFRTPDGQIDGELEYQVFRLAPKEAQNRYRAQMLAGVLADNPRISTA